MLELTGFLGLTRISFFLLTQIPLYSTLLLCGWEISQMLLCVGWLVRIPLGFWAHTDLTDPTVLLCGWEISQMALWVWAPGGCTGLALTDLSFGPFGQIRPIGQIGRIGHF